MGLDGDCFPFSSPCPHVAPLLPGPLPAFPLVLGQHFPGCGCSMGPVWSHSVHPLSSQLPPFTPALGAASRHLLAPVSGPKFEVPVALLAGDTLSASSSADPECPESLCSTPGLRDIGDPQGGMLGLARDPLAARMGLGGAMATAPAAARGMLLPARVCALSPLLLPGFPLNSLINISP